LVTTTTLRVDDSAVCNWVCERYAWTDTVRVGIEFRKVGCENLKWIEVAESEILQISLFMAVYCLGLQNRVALVEHLVT
jgi:hypothetical protein